MYSPACYSRRRWTYPKDEDRNFVAAFFHLITIVLICTSLVQLKWFRLWGGHCVAHLSTNQFFGFGEFYATTQSQYHLRNGGLITSPSGYVIHYNTSTESLACVTPDVANLMHILIILAVLSMFSSSVGFCLDMVGPTRHYLKLLRRNAVPSITTVLLVITMVGTSYFVTKSLEVSLYEMKIQSDMQITYDYGCYVVTAAGSFSILATACNLLQSPVVVEDLQRHARLVEDWDGPETFSVGMRNMPHPPPPYTP
uniref:Transmembrane protein 127 transmembrane region domain-containing protein n=1 Tax=Cuerna arida TaxID=1464854 RepID=A0A1B6GPG2_9HEMI